MRAAMYWVRKEWATLQERDTPACHQGLSNGLPRVPLIHPRSSTVWDWGTPAFRVELGCE